MSELNVFIGKVNAPAEGQWFHLLAMSERDDAIEYTKDLREYIISDYEAPFHIEETDSIEKLAKIAEAAASLDNETEQAVFFAEVEYADDIEELADEIENGSYTIIVIDGDGFSYSSNSHEALGYYMAEQTLGLDEFTERYFDYEAFGRDWAYDYIEIELEDAYLFYSC